MVSSIAQVKLGEDRVTRETAFFSQNSLAWMGASHCTASKPSVTMKQPSQSCISVKNDRMLEAWQMSIWPHDLYN